MAQQEFSIKKLADRLHTEADAYRMLEELRWGGDPEACPKCGGIGRCSFIKPANGDSRKTRTGANTQRRVWFCGHCRKQFSVLTDTIFHGTKISIRTWLFVIFEFCAAKNSISAWEISRKYEITNESAWHMLHRIREAMKREPVAGLFTGTVAADETWVGGKPGNWSNKKRREAKADQHKWARPKTDKPAVMALVNKETGEVRSRVIPDVTGDTLAKVLREEADLENTTLVTDEAKGYRPVGAQFADHKRVNHSARRYVNKDGATTNAAESYFSQLKRSIDGTHHHVSKEHLARYLAQFDFMRTWCETDDSDRMRGVIQQVAGRRLTYKPLTSE
ncbi:MAG: IS1595 family transposase [Actinomycetes bacterium]